MAKYSVNIGITYWVDADDADSAEDMAAELARQEWGDTFIRTAWVCDAEHENQA